MAQLKPANLLLSNPCFDVNGLIHRYDQGPLDRGGIFQKEGNLAQLIPSVDSATADASDSYFKITLDEALDFLYRAKEIEWTVNASVEVVDSAQGSGLLSYTGVNFVSSIQSTTKRVGGSNPRQSKTMRGKRNPNQTVPIIIDGGLDDLPEEWGFTEGILELPMINGIVGGISATDSFVIDSEESQGGTSITSIADISIVRSSSNLDDAYIFAEYRLLADTSFSETGNVFANSFRGRTGSLVLINSHGVEHDLTQPERKDGVGDAEVTSSVILKLISPRGEDKANW